MRRGTLLDPDVAPGSSPAQGRGLMFREVGLEPGRCRPQGVSTWHHARVRPNDAGTAPEPVKRDPA